MQPTRDMMFSGGTKLTAIPKYFPVHLYFSSFPYQIFSAKYKGDCSVYMCNIYVINRSNTCTRLKYCIFVSL